MLGRSCMKIDYLTGKYNGLATFYSIGGCGCWPGACTGFVGGWWGVVRSIVICYNMFDGMTGSGRWRAAGLVVV